MGTKVLQKMKKSKEKHNSIHKHIHRNTFSDKVQILFSRWLAALKKSNFDEINLIGLVQDGREDMRSSSFCESTEIATRC